MLLCGCADCKHRQLAGFARQAGRVQARTRAVRPLPPRHAPRPRRLARLELHLPPPLLPLLLLLLLRCRLLRACLRGGVQQLLLLVCLPLLLPRHRRRLHHGLRVRLDRGVAVVARQLLRSELWRIQQQVVDSQPGGGGGVGRQKRGGEAEAACRPGQGGVTDGRQLQKLLAYGEQAPKPQPTAPHNLYTARRRSQCSAGTWTSRPPSPSRCSTATQA